MQNKIYITPYTVRTILNPKIFVKFFFLMKNVLCNADFNGEFETEKESESSNQALLL